MPKMFQQEIQVSAPQEALMANRTEPVTFVGLELYAECPCCEAKQEPHDAECTLSVDDTVAFDELKIFWSHNARVAAMRQRVEALQVEMHKMYQHPQEYSAEGVLLWISDKLTALLGKAGT